MKELFAVYQDVELTFLLNNWEKGGLLFVLVHLETSIEKVLIMIPLIKLYGSIVRMLLLCSI